jgi:hypothetical protein
MDFGSHYLVPAHGMELTRKESERAPSRDVALTDRGEATLNLLV